MPALLCIADSEDESESESPIASPALTGSPLLPVFATSIIAKPTPVELDMIDIAPVLERRNARQCGKAGRKRAESSSYGDVSSSDGVHKTRRVRTSAEASQRAWSERLTPDINLLPDTGDTIKIASAECDALLKRMHQEQSPAVDPRMKSESNSSSSVPWSAGPVTTSPIGRVAPDMESRPSQSAQPLLNTCFSTDGRAALQSPIPLPSHEIPARGNSQADNLYSGLPMEQYKPRPSRSRSAQVAEVNVDCSIAPEKASKSKKRRSESVGQDIHSTKRKRAGVDTHGDEMLQEELIMRARQAQEEDSSDIRVAAVSSQESIKKSHPTTPSIADTSGNEPSHDQETGHFTAAGVLFEAVNPSANATPRTASEPEHSLAATQSDTPTFAVPGLPASATSVSSKKSKARRSHTTIFEDHVGLGERPDASPNLRQLQAQRKRGRPRKSPPPDDLRDDDEVEVQQEPRKRGRPRRSAVPDDVRDDTEMDVQIAIEETEQPIPKRRGRPRKTPLKQPTPELEQPAGAEEADTNEVEEENLFAVDGEVEASTNGSEDVHIVAEEEPPPIQPVPEHVVSATEEDNAVIGAGKENLPTNPTKAQTAELIPPPTRTTHSPIKKNGTTFRVGLSKRQRITPLLRMLKR